MSEAQEWSASDLADYDQHLSAAGDELDRLTAALRYGLSTGCSEHQALANIGALLATKDQTELVGLLSVALRRIAAGAEERWS